MKSISIHNLDETLETLIRKKAKKSGLSLNKMIQNLLKKSLDLPTGEVATHEEDFRHLCGVWSKEDYQEFEKAVEPFDYIHPEDWQ